MRLRFTAPRSFGMDSPVHVVVAVVSLLLGPVVVSARCPSSATAAFLAPGPYGVGVRTLPLVDTSRPTPAHGTISALPSRQLTTEVWYPTAPHTGAPQRDAAAAAGRFPLVINSHGYSDVRTGEAYVAEALASRGYVVAAPDFPLTNLTTAPPRDPADVVNQPGDVRFVLDQILALARTDGSWLDRRINRHRIAATGLSYGGLTTLLVAYHPTLRDRRIRAVAAVAPAACSLGDRFFRAARPKLLLVQGTQDLLVPIEANAERVFMESRSQRWLVQLIDATHTAFSGVITFTLPTSYDAALGCAAVVNDFSAENLATLSMVLDDPANGIDLSGCTPPCSGPVPTNAPMTAARQHDLTRAAVVAFLEFAFRHDATARCVLRESLAQDNPDVRVDVRRRGR